MIINCDCNKEQLYRKRLATGASFFYWEILESCDCHPAKWGVAFELNRSLCFVLFPGEDGGQKMMGGCFFDM